MRDKISGQQRITQSGAFWMTGVGFLAGWGFFSLCHCWGLPSLLSSG